MTDKEQIKCNYKFQDKERFDGKPYCTCFDRWCEDLFFICDHNCQVYEDLKQLASKTQLSIKQSKELIRLRQELKESTVKNKNLKQECEQKDERIIELTKENKKSQKGIKEWNKYVNLVRSWITQAAKDLGLDTEHSFGTEHFTFAVRCLKEEHEKLKQECEELEDFRTLVREPFAFGDSDVDDESFIKYLNEYVTDMTKALDGYQKLTDILEIDWTIHGAYDIEEIIKQVTELKQECEELKEEIKTYKRILNNPEHKVALTDVRTGEREVWRKLGRKAGRYRKALEEIEEIVKQTCRKRCTNDCLGTRKHCGYGAIFNIINKVKGEECN